MANTKKNNILITILLLTFGYNTYTMEVAEKPSWLTSWFRSLIFGEVVHGGAAPAPKSFTDLPKELKGIILGYLAMGANATSIEEAGQAIKSLSHVNKELNQLINDPQFCLQTIKHLAKKFNCTDETAARALATREAQRRLEIQKKAIASIEKAMEDSTEELLSQEIDINFIYDNTNPSYKDKNHGKILLMYALVNNPNFIAKLNANNTNFIINLIEKSKNVINYRNHIGNTALLQFIGCITNAKDISKYKDYILTIMEALLNAGADPKIANNYDTTPFTLAQRTRDQNIIDLITNAIKQKHSTKEQR
jgi:hypothetical protein